MEVSLYRRYRPQKFSDVAGQSAAVNVVVKSLERSRVGHAYLFSGPRGCGKTTVARLLAKALDCLSPVQGPDGPEPCCECKNCLAITAGESLDVIEIDGASNNSVDEVRELKSHVTLTPFSSRYKVYIIDEVHMLTINAFNALLKTLEEPPDYVVFILATTEAHKVPVTIRSRCQHIPFRRIGTQDIYDRLAKVCGAESLAYQPEALREIARQADGALRDALSMLEQVAGLGKPEISLADVEATLGQGSRSSIERWLAAWHGGDDSTFLELDRMLAGGASPQRFIEELFSLVRNLWLTAKWKNIPDSMDISDQEKTYLKAEAPGWEPAELESAMVFLSELLPQVRMGLRIDVLSGLLMTKMVHLKDGLTAPAAVVPHAAPAAAPRPARREPAEPAFTEPAAAYVNEEELPPPLPAPWEITDEPKKYEPEREEPQNSQNPQNLPTSPKTQNIPKEAPASAPLDPAGWTPWPAERWDEALKTLQEKEFLLYCASMDAVPFMDESTDESMNESAEKKLILDMTHRYCYEVLRLDRNRALLKSLLTPLNDGAALILRCGELWVSCSLQETPAPRKKSPGKRAAREPAVVWETMAEDLEKVPDPPQVSQTGVPFDGLVREVTRWMRGDVILVRRGDSDDDDTADEQLIEE